MRSKALLVAGVALALAGAPASAASLVLSDRARQEALLLGQRSVTQETFGAEWRVLNGSEESVEVMTPFHRIALAARHAAFKNEPLKSEDQERMLLDLKDRLMFSVQLLGPRPDFARYYRPRLLLADGREVEPAVAQNDRTALRREDGRYLAHCTYWFPAKDVTGTSRLTLAVRDPEGQSVARFVIDLARMR